jgi:hypothetical protein
MFHPRPTDFDPRLSAIVDHLRAIEKELSVFGKGAGRRASTTATATANQIADAVGPILNDIVARFSRGQRVAVDEAANFGNDALRLGTRFGNEALGRIAGQAKQRPLLTVAVAIGIGVLIGAASRRS